MFFKHLKKTVPAEDKMPIMGKYGGRPRAYRREEMPEARCSRWWHLRIGTMPSQTVAKVSDDDIGKSFRPSGLSHLFNAHTRDLYFSRNLPTEAPSYSYFTLDPPVTSVADLCKGDHTDLSQLAFASFDTGSAQTASRPK